MKEDNEQTESSELKNIFAQNLLFFRKKNNMSQKELSDSLNTSNKNISKWERAETIPDILTIKKLAKIFNVTVDILINPITNDNKKAIVEKVTVPFKWKLAFMFLINSVLILLACVLFFVFEANKIYSIKPAFLFIYILPMIDLTIFIFICVTKKKVDAVSLSLFGWLVTLCFFISFIEREHIAYIFVITIAYQILTPFFAYLINSRKIITINKLLISKIKKQSQNEDNSEINKEKLQK